MIFNFKIYTPDSDHKFTREFETKQEAIAFASGIAQSAHITSIPITANTYIQTENGYFNDDLELVEECGGEKKWDIITSASSPALWYLQR